MLPGSLHQFLLPLDLRFRNILCRLLHVLRNLGLLFLEAAQVLVLLLGDLSL